MRGGLRALLRAVLPKPPTALGEVREPAFEYDAAMAARWSVECRELTLVRGGRTVLAPTTLAISCDECVSCVGPNGAGKTSLLLAVLGLLPPAGGTASLAGCEAAQWPPRARARLLAYVPQALIATPWFRVREIICDARFAHVGGARRLAPRDAAVVQRVIETCDLDRLADRSFHTLSGGERQKTLLAAAMAQEPQMLCLDEPTAALDPGYQRELVRILNNWCAAGRGLFCVSHDLSLPAALGGRVVALVDGHVVADGPAAEVLTPPRLAEIFALPVGLP